MALTDKLTAIGNAIRGKTGGSAQLSLTDMATAITNLSTQQALTGKIVGKAVNITSGGTNYFNVDISNTGFVPGQYDNWILFFPMKYDNTGRVGIITNSTAAFNDKPKSNNTPCAFYISSATMGNDSMDMTNSTYGNWITRATNITLASMTSSQIRLKNGVASTSENKVKANTVGWFIYFDPTAT